MNRTDPERHYDVIVIGAGMGGLAAGARLATAGKKVLLVEKEAQVGGLMSPLVHGPYTFDVGARLLMGCNGDGPYGPGAIHVFLDRIGARQKVEFIPKQPILEVRFPDSRFPVFSGREQLIEGLCQAAPRGLERLPELLDLCSGLYRDSGAFTRQDLPWTPWRGLREMPGLFRYATTTLDSVLCRYFTEPRARAVMGALWPYLGVPPRRASFLAWALMVSAYIDEGAWYCRGSLGRLAEVIAEAYTQAGGDLRLRCAVGRVLVRDRRVIGVDTADGERYFAPAVIANIDPRVVFGPMMDPAEAPARYRRGLERMTPSIAGITLSFVTDLDLAGLGWPFENLIFDSWDEDATSRTPLTGEAGSLSINISTLADPGLARPGQHAVTAFTGLPSRAPQGPDDVQRYALALRRVTEQHIPALPGHLLLAGTEEAPDGYLTRCGPSIYGWELSPWQASLGRPNLHTPVRGLLLAGHWTLPLHGVMPVILSGWEVARVLLR